MLTIAEVTKALPPNLKSAATQTLVDKINNITTDPVVAEMVRDNFISYTKVLQEGKFKTEDYLNAVAFVSYQLMGYSNQDCYFRTFPQRHAALVAANTASKDIAAYVSAYSKGKLVNLIRENALVPTWVLNQDTFQKAINVQADLMVNAQSEMVRMQAANSLLTHLAKPKEAGPLIAIDMRENSGMTELKETLVKMAEQQQALIQAGVTVKQIAEQEIVDVEAKQV